MVKGTVSITLSDFQGLLEAATKAKETEENLRRAAKELQVFLSYIALKADIEKYVDEFNTQSTTSKIIFDGSKAKIEIKDV